MMFKYYLVWRGVGYRTAVDNIECKKFPI